MKKTLILTTMVILMIGGSAANAATLYVNCGAKVGLTSIGAALKILQRAEAGEPNTVNVSGVCYEDVVIQSMDHLTLNALNGASITDPSLGANTAVSIDDSRDVTVNNFIINGYAPGNSGNDVLDCSDGSVCRLNGNTAQNAPQGAGIGIFAGSFAVITGGMLQNNSFAGLVVANGAKVRAEGVIVQRNSVGVFVNDGGFLQFASSTSSGNDAQGILARQGGAVICASCIVRGNGFATGSDGILVEQSSSIVFQHDFGVSPLTDYSVTGNAAKGISLFNLSGVTFNPHGTVTGNASGGLTVACNPSFTTAAGLSNAGLIPNSAQTTCVGP